MNKNCFKEVAQEHNGKVYKLPVGVNASNVETDDTRQFISKAELNDLKAKPGPTSVLNNNMVTFTPVVTRSEIESGDTLSTLFGKIKKWFSDMRSGAFADVTDALDVTTEGYVADARATKNLNEKFGGMFFYEDATGKYVVGADSVPKKLGSPEIVIITVGNTNPENRVTFDIKTLYSGFVNLTTNNFAFGSCDAQKTNAQGQNDTTRHWYSLLYDKTGILTCVPHYREWGSDYDRSGEGRGSGPDITSPIILFAPKL